MNRARDVHLLMVLGSATPASRSMPDPGPVDIIHTNHQATRGNRRHISDTNREIENPAGRKSNGNAGFPTYLGPVGEQVDAAVPWCWISICPVL